MATIADVPSYDAYMWPIIERLKAHGRSLANDEMLDDIASHMGLSAEVRSVPHGKTSKSEVDYRMAWARTYLKKAGAVENSARGVWRLTPAGAALTAAEVRAIPRTVQQQYAAGRTVDAPASGLIGTDESGSGFPCSTSRATLGHAHRYQHRCLGF